jgi:hypothetical protein
MNRPIRAGDYVEHFDPELPHHRVWLQEVLEQLVSHDPQALEEGGTLRRLWIQHQEAILVGVPYFQQRDSVQRNQRDRSCFSSSCAMLLEALKPGTLPGVNGDDAYLAVVQRYGDTTDAGAQLQALAHYGVSAQLVQDADFQLIEQQIARGIPVPCGYIHRGPIDRPTGSGHWLIVVGHTPTQVVVNDPWGDPDLIHGTTLNANGMGLRFSRLNYRCAGLRLRQALDGGAHRWRCLPLCPRHRLGGGGGQHPLRRSLRGAFSAAAVAGGGSVAPPA